MAELTQPVEIDELLQRGRSFRSRLDAVKDELDQPDLWYPYDTLGNLDHLGVLLRGVNRRLQDLAEGKAVADIGAADGTLAFFLEELGYEVDIVDHAPSNFNGLRGARALRDALGSNCRIQDLDLDANFTLPRSRYGLVFFLGILYHLQSPYYALRSLARQADHCVLSTRIARETTDHSVSFADVPVAYLVAPHETNSDPTNYWIFSPEGARRILDRTGWEILDWFTVGNVEHSDPATWEGDERLFCLLRSRVARN